jgi:elongation factor G
MTDQFVPMIEMPIKLPTNVDRALLLATLSDLAADDVQFQFLMEGEATEVALSGIDELQLDEKVATLRRVLGMEISVGSPQVAFRETITRYVEIDYTHKKVHRGIGEFARVKLALKPSGFDGVLNCQIETTSAELPDEYMAGIRTGLEASLRRGAVSGFPVIGVTATLVDSAWHEIDSNAGAFDIAARHAMSGALRDAAPIMLEPMMKIEVVTPNLKT